MPSVAVAAERLRACRPAAGVPGPHNERHRHLHRRRARMLVCGRARTDARCPIRAKVVGAKKKVQVRRSTGGVCKPPAQPTLVRTQHLPPTGRQDHHRTSEPLSGSPAGAPSCPAASDPHRPSTAVRGTCAERSRGRRHHRAQPSACKVHGGLYAASRMSSGGARRAPGHFWRQLPADDHEE
jgi:hypothetical protein